MVFEAYPLMSIAQTIRVITTKKERKKMSREKHSKAKLEGICNYRLYTTEELIETYAFESSRICKMDRENAQKAIRKELKRRFNATLTLLDDEQTINNPTGTYRYLLNVRD